MAAGQSERHPLGGPVCGAVNPTYPDEVCTRKLGHEVVGRGRDKLHHVRGTDRKWDQRGPWKARQ